MEPIFPIMGFKNPIKKYLDKRKERRQFLNASTEEVFTMIYKSNKWGDNESCSGKGSNLLHTEALREQLPALLAKYSIQSMLDIPCGDYHWMKEMALELESYIGADIVIELVNSVKESYEDETHKFIQLDLIKNPLPKVDLIFCRDCLVHLCFEDIDRAITNIRASECEYFMTTTFINIDRNRDKITGKHKVLNLQLPPFNWPEPIDILEEICIESSYADKGKSLALWKVADLKQLEL